MTDSFGLVTASCVALVSEVAGPCTAALLSCTDCELHGGGVGAIGVVGA